MSRISLALSWRRGKYPGFLYAASSRGGNIWGPSATCQALTEMVEVWPKDGTPGPVFGYTTPCSFHVLGRELARGLFVV